MHIRKLRNKWQCIVRIKNIALAQSFISKADARKWGNKQEAQIRLGAYSDDSKLTNLRLRDLLKLYFDKAVKVSRRMKKIILLLTLLILAGCATGPTTPPESILTSNRSL